MKPALVRHISLSFPSLLNAVKNKPSAVPASRRKAVATLGLPPQTPLAKWRWSALRDRLSTQPERPTLDLARLLSEDRNDLR